ncbi:rod shape-determining protein [Dactylosporangium sp. NPDC048998]|uniref:rod shape-determining protein n=1 Tax=Dactylosporangium sp. NPDC048998 TaxID=3363976 RepID=UPI00372259CB
MFTDVIAPATTPATTPRPAAHAAVQPTAVGVDIGGAYTRIWTSGRPLMHARSRDRAAGAQAAVRRGRIADPAAARSMLAGLFGGYDRPVPPGATVVACRPVHTNGSDEHALRQTLADVLAPGRLLFIDSIRAAAIGAGAAPGPLLVVDLGAQVTEAAVLAGGGVVDAARHEVGLDDVTGPDTEETVVAAVVDLLGRLRRERQHRQAVAAAAHGGLLLVGGGANRPRLVASIAAAVDVPVRRPAAPHLVAVRGAGLAALAALRRAVLRG